MIRGALAILLLLVGVASGEQGLREEQLAAKAGKVWKEWSHVWDGSVTDDEMRSSLASESSFRWDAPKGTPKELSGGFLVGDRASSEQVVEGRDEVLKSFRQWPSSWSSGTVERSKFKVVKVKVTDERLQTTELVALLAKGTKADEYNGVWETQWVIQEGELKHLATKVLSSRVVTLGEGSLFQDVTSSILPVDCREDPELTEENIYWRERVPAAFEPDQFGETGVSIADVNGDGLEDVYLCQIAGLRNRLWLRTDKGLLKESPPCGLEIRDNTCAALFVDFDSDGDRDAVLTTSVGVIFFENDGKGIFIEKHKLASIPHGFGMAATDYDQDGDLDLYICQYYESRKEGEAVSRGSFPHPYPIYNALNGGRNVLLENQGDWKFEDVTDKAGLDENNSRLSYACLWEDFDNDGDQDLFVVNDFGPNNYLLNDGKGRFVDHSGAPGVKDGGFGMGLTVADFNHDGRYDIHISNMYSGAGNRIARQDWFHANKDQKIRDTLLSLARGNTLLENIDGKAFSDVSGPSGIAMGRWSWASLAVDLNNDTRDDLLVANGFVTGRDPDDL